MPDSDPCTTASPGQPMTSVRQSIWRCRPGDELTIADDDLAAEAPLEIRVRSQAVCVTMRTPSCSLDDGQTADTFMQTDRELAAGFLLCEGVIQAATDIDRIVPCARATEGNVLNVFLAPHVDFDLSRLTRHVFASSSCGICGKASIDSILSDFDPLDPPRKGDDHALIDAALLSTFPDKLLASQPGFGRTGGLHAAGLFDAQGELLVAREDIGRHNAVDKVLGYLLLQERLPLSAHVLMVSGRVSFEIMQKALAARVPVVAAVSAPSSLAVEFARDSGQTLAGFVRDGRFNLYAHPQRIRAASNSFGGE